MAQLVKNLPTMQETWVLSQGWEDLLEKGKATHSSIPEFHVLQSMRLLFEQLSLHSGGASGKEPACQCRRLRRRGFHPWEGQVPWRRAWQSTPVFLPAESPWTEEPGGLQSIGSQRIRHD